MTSPDTKIELVVESIEALTLAQHAQLSSHDTRHSLAKMQDVVDARENLKTALSDFLRPSLRIVTEHEKRVGAASVTSRKTVEASR